jgi:mercuric ion binding protein
MKLITIAAGLALVGSLASAKEVTTAMKVPGMDCDACTVVIRHALTQTKGVKTVGFNVDKRVATIVYEDTQVTELRIQRAIEKSGFKTEPSKSGN